jgi:protein-disulfide isomerase
LYLSPDGNFLAPFLLDMSVDPLEEDRQRRLKLLEGFQVDPSPARGPPNGKEIIVEFADFECPFCAQFYGLYESLPRQERDQVTLVFKHLPLEGHPWAMQAAVAAACAFTQSQDVFWRLHDFLFQNQANLSAETFRDQVLKFMASNGANLDAFARCQQRGMGERMVMRDIELAHRHRVEGTPTLFVNGRRLTGAISSLSQLRSALRDGAETPEEDLKDGAQPRSGVGPQPPRR